MASTIRQYPLLDRIGCLRKSSPTIHTISIALLSVYISLWCFNLPRHSFARKVKIFKFSFSERPPKIIKHSSLRFTIVWNPGGFHLVNILPKGFKFNASYYVTQILDLYPYSEEVRLGEPIEN
jgi:hypothetical protein